MSGTITSAADALHWIKTTFCYQMSVVTGKYTDSDLALKIEQEMQALSVAECITWDAQQDNAKPLDLGIIMVSE